VSWGRLVFSSGTLASSTNKTDHHDITEILLKVALNTITINRNSNFYRWFVNFFFTQDNKYLLSCNKRDMKNYCWFLMCISLKLYCYHWCCYDKFRINILSKICFARNGLLVAFHMSDLVSDTKLLCEIHSFKANQR
jgi:hypothetical protein